MLQPRSDRKPYIHAILSTWLAVIGMDFFFNAGILAPLWQEESAFLLPAGDLFARIPLGYAAFLLWAILAVWLIARTGVQRPIEGALVATKVGVLVSVSGTLALVSISTISVTLAVTWMFLQIIEFAYAGYVAAVVLGGATRRAALKVAGAAVLMAVAGLVIQNLR